MLIQGFFWVKKKDFFQSPGPREEGHSTGKGRLDLQEGGLPTSWDHLPLSILTSLLKYGTLESKRILALVWSNQ